MIEGLTELDAALSDSKWARPQSFASQFEASNTEIAKILLHALESPVGFHPPLSQSVFAGDQVAIVLQPDLPQPQLVLECVLSRLFDTSIEPSDVTVVLSPTMARQFGLKLNSETASDSDVELPHPLDDKFRSVEFIIHDASDEQAVAYIAANALGLPVKINRAIVDADVVLPVGCPRPGEKDGLVDCIYPDFGNSEIQSRYRDRHHSVKERKAEIELANDQLGTFFSIQLVPGAGGQILNIVSGERHAAIEQASSESDQAWSIPPMGDAEMAIATIESNGESAGWKDFAHALVAANSVAMGAGPIVIWSEIRERPKNEIRKALNESFELKTGSKLSGLMKQVAGIAAERQIFLKSNLAQSAIEELGLGYVGSVADIQRMVDQSSNGVLLRDAHLCQIHPQHENANVDA